MDAIKMSAKGRTVFAIAGESAAPLALAPPRGWGARLAMLAPVATALPRARQFLAAHKGNPRKRPAASGPQEPPDEQPEADRIWDDPAIWMLMMH
jgi:hypothetical protein